MDELNLGEFVPILFALEEELRWEELGASYCEAGGEVFFVPEQREAIRDAGLLFASDVASALGELDSVDEPASLYVGAAVAELVPALFESVVLGRRVVLHNLPGDELDELNRALASVGKRFQLELPRLTSEPLEELQGPFQHVWMTSVLSDPDHFPALHNKVYERTGARAVLGGDLGIETQIARHLMRTLVAMLRSPGLFTTSDEEAPFLTKATKRRGLKATRPEEARLSAIVGDPIRVWRLF